MVNPQTLIIITIWLVTGNALFGQLEKLRFEHITVEQGLSDNNALCAIKDAKGYMWFGTWNGLNKYDGYNITNYFTDPYDSGTISYNTIYSIYGDKNNKLWFTIAGADMTSYNLSTETFKRFAPDRSNGHTIHIGVTRAVIQDTSGIFWIGNNNGELGRFDPKTNAFLAWSAADSMYLQKNLHLSTVVNIDNFYIDRRGGMWIGGYSGLHHYVPDAKKDQVHFVSYVHNANDSNSLSDNRVTCIYETRNGLFWIGTANGLNRWDRKTNKMTVFTHSDVNPLSISWNFVTGIVEDKNGNLWVSTRNGLNVFNPEEKNVSFVHYLHDPDEPTSIGSNFIFSEYIDSSDVLWVSTLGGGISKLDLNQKPIHVYRNKASDKNSLSDNKVTAILEDDSGIVWIGTAHGGLNAWNRNANRFVRYTHDSLKEKSIAGNQIGSMLLDSDGDLWIGSGEGNRTAAISRFNRSTSTFKNYFFNYPYAGPPSGNALLSLYQTRDGTIWIGTSHGFIQFDKKTGQHTYVRYDPENSNGITDYWVNCFYEDKHGYLWMGPNSNALNKLDRRTGKVMHYEHNDRDTTSISSSKVKSMFKDSRGNVWFGTRSGGLALLNEDNGTFKNFTTRDGLPSNTVFSIAEDNENNLWLTTTKGLCKFNYALRTATTYTTADGLPVNHFEAEVGSGVPAYKAKDGTLLFGGPDGLIVFDPDKIRQGKPPGEVQITQFRIFDRPVKGLIGDTITLNHDENFFSFEFASLNYANHSENHYAYFLHGLDKDWVYAGSRRLATYTNLNPGEYIFSVKASTDNKHWKEIKSPVMLIILPPWWATVWFYMAVSAIVIAAVYMLFRYRLNQKVKIFRIRNRIHRDLHDDVGATLSSVKAYSEILKDNPDKPMIADLIIENANEMIVSLEDISWATNPQFDNMNSLIAKIKKFAVPLMHAKKIEFTLSASGIDETFQMPGEVRRNVLLIAKEAINNVYKYSMADKCSVTFSLAHRMFSVLIKDDGVGMTGMVQGAGYGIKNMRRRISELNGKMDVHSHLGAGTSIHLMIKYPFTFTPADARI